MLLGRSARAAVAAITVGLVLMSAGIANASHFRASDSSVSVSGTTLTWNLNSAWRIADDDYFETDTIGDEVEITELSTPSDDPGTGSSTGEVLALTAFSIDESNPLYTVVNQTFAGDVSGLGDGLYELYFESCCRVDGIENGTEDYSQWIRFSISGGVVNVSPSFISSSVFEIIDPVSGATINYQATDPESEAFALELIADTSSPFYGSDTVPCSTFSGGVFTVSPALCTGGDVFSTIFTPGSYWSIKMSATDAGGNQSIVDTLLRVASAPEPYIDDDDKQGNGTQIEFTVIAEDTLVNSWTVTCVGDGDPSDIVTGTTASSPAAAMATVVLRGLTVGESYTCEVSATNSAGTGVSADEYGIGPIELDGVLLLLDAEVGDDLSGILATLSGANLDADSAWTLVQHSDPITLTSGTADGAGNFSSSLALPASVCVPGVHALTLSGVSGGSAVTDSAWYELSGDCTILQFSRTGAVTPAGLAATGGSVNPYLVSGGAIALALGLGALVLVRRRAVS